MEYNDVFNKLVDGKEVIDCNKEFPRTVEFLKNLNGMATSRDILKSIYSKEYKEDILFYISVIPKIIGTLEPEINGKEIEETKDKIEEQKSISIYIGFTYKYIDLKFDFVFFSLTNKFDSKQGYDRYDELLYYKLMKFCIFGEAELNVSKIVAGKSTIFVDNKTPITFFDLMKIKYPEIAENKKKDIPVNYTIK